MSPRDFCFEALVQENMSVNKQNKKELSRGKKKKNTLLWFRPQENLTHHQPKTYKQSVAAAEMFAPRNEHAQSEESVAFQSGGACDYVTTVRALEKVQPLNYKDKKKKRKQKKTEKTFPCFWSEPSLLTRLQMASLQCLPRRKLPACSVPVHDNLIYSYSCDNSSIKSLAVN